MQQETMTMESVGREAASNARAPLRVTVLAGGPSAERAISLNSGAAIAEALRRCGHHVHVADINPEDVSALSAENDVIFPALHGTFGEDGQVQRLMEERGLQFVGSRSRASAIAMDKIAAKRIVQGLGLATPEFEEISASDFNRGQWRLSAPVVAKPVDQGSSVDTAVCRSNTEIAPALERVITGHGRALLERFISGRELTVGIVAGEALPPICIRPRQGFYDYHAKYQAEDTEYLFDAGFLPEWLERLQVMSRKVFEAVGCRHLARVDWMVDDEQRPWFLEVNTLPGFTSHSLLPKAAARVGISFDELCDRLVRMAYEERA